MPFPTSIDSFTTKVDGVSDVLAADINNLQAGLVATQQKLGINGSGNTSSVDYLLSLLKPLTLATAVNTTSGSAIDFTGIPSWVRRITVMFNGVSTNGSSIPQLQLGSGSVQATGYLNTAGNIYSSTPGTGSPQGSNLTFGFGLIGVSNSSASVASGHMVCTLLSSNLWVCSGVIAFTNASQAVATAGNVTLSGALDRLRLTTVNGSDTFDAGSVNIMYEG
jgi:hypothetical protein